MKNLASRLPKTVRHPYFPIVLILIANLIIGLFTFQDYGLSWDEPLFYQYAEAVPYAYSISARMQGDFDLEKAYGPSAEDHKIYGPVYLLIAKPVVDLLDQVLPVPRADLWHLVNFITFQVGVVLLFALCLRWMTPWVASAAALLFSTQPILWGHSWINPKDIPFTVFFLAAIYFGFKMVDALSDPGDATGNTAEFVHEISAKRWKTFRIVLQVLAVILVISSLVIFVFYLQIQGLLGDLIRNAYSAPPDSLLGKIFAGLAANAQSIPEAAYINKGLILLSRVKILVGILAIVFLIPAILLTFWMPSIQRRYRWLMEALDPLPVKPEWWWSRVRSWRILLLVLLAGILLGWVTSIRVIGPLAGLLVFLYFFFKPGRHSLGGMLIYGLASLLALYIAWPFLWPSPLARFIDVLQHMSNNPQVLPVLYNGTVIGSDKLPITYLPVMLGITLTWPVWPLFITGLWAFWSRFRSGTIDWRSMTPILLWFLIPFIYVLVTRPPMYDGYRHFLFILPPIFILGGIAMQAIREHLRTSWSFTLILIVLVIPGLIGLVRLHPYEYTYYNQIVGGTGGAYRRFETDFWLTCYKELLPQLAEPATDGKILFVHRQPPIAREYAPPGVTIERFDRDDDRTFPGSLLLLTTRANVDLSIHPEAVEVLSVGREGAVFCLVREIP